MLGCIFYRYKSKKPEKTMDKNIDQIYKDPINEEKISGVVTTMILPKEWIEKCSLSGETYWYNINTHEKTFSKPNKKICDVN